MELDQLAQKEPAKKESATHYIPAAAKTDTKNYIIVALATALIVLGLVWIRDSGTDSGAAPTGAAGFAPSPQPSQIPSQPSVNIDMKTLADDDAFLGKEDAPVTMIEFSDYQCPFCGRFFTQTLPSIKSKYIDTGKVKFVYRDFPINIHPEAEPAAIAANCAGKQGKYFEFHDKIFENQQQLSATNYKKWATELKLDLNQWDDCLKDPAQLQEVQKDLSDGSRVGVQGTPAFFIGGRLISGAQPYTVFEAAIEQELGN